MGPRPHPGPGGDLSALTFHQLVQAGNLLQPIDGVDCSHSLGQVHVIRQSSGQIRQQGLEGPEACLLYTSDAADDWLVV